jgi:hypothetical protein
MEIRDGFIVGIYNYCDAWCDRCPFTSHCRVFADARQTEASLDPNLQAVAMLPNDPPDTSPTPSWLRELLDEIEGAVHTPSVERTHRAHRILAVPERDDIDRRAEDYSRRVRSWSAGQQVDSSSDGNDPRAVIVWFHMMIHVKAMRALQGLAEDDPSDRRWPADHDGSAKVALVGIDRSHTAWRDLVSVGFVTASEAAPFIEDLIWLRAALERTFPNARSFVRTAFDEPDEVARLLQR